MNNQKLVEESFDCFNKHEWEKIPDLCTDVAKIGDPSIAKLLVKQGKEKIMERHLKLGFIYPNFKNDIVHIYNLGDPHTIIKVLSPGIAIYGSKFILPFCVTYTTKRGKITKKKHYNVEE